MEAVYGINPIKVLLARQGTPLKRIIVAEGRSGAAVKEIVDAARQKKVPVEWRRRQDLDELTGRRDHQGIVGFRSSFVYADLDVLLKNRNPCMSHDLILILDGILDPQNLGSIIRSAHCLGANGVVIPADRAASVTPAVMKASAGSAEYLPIVRVTNVSRTIDDLKGKGFWVFGAETHGGKDIRDHNFNVPAVLVMGSEDRGIRPLVKRKCDFLVTIPMAGEFDSFNVAVAAGIIQYAILLHRWTK
ncbi:MAG: 23S rRNA (guanosine(2251)-2'-O)-methyltransferase RlmB [Deltaproteobacteria bacterium HGW-Deltaproteobacteria-1]|jgi:23S rRNA (guanosine2251-2'-O)-methyltransferase|nr:MAG: 23S rRNA (guanosine(2251)-2'-O)-methyltransferase RlmB [Deltaproteobacteria bacterium HGW-Deltaproteobacteria-1]